MAIGVDEATRHTSREHDQTRVTVRQGLEKSDWGATFPIFSFVLVLLLLILLSSAAFCMALLRTGWSAAGDGQELQWWFSPEHGVLVGLRYSFTVRTLVCRLRESTSERFHDRWFAW